MTRHDWWHRPRDGYFAVSTDESGAIVSAWLQVGRYQWEPLDDFLPLQAADARGEIHTNPHGYTDSLGPSLGSVQ
jgi:hypothetical protein